MTIEISDTIIKKSKLTSQDILLRVAILLFVDEEVTLAQAAQIAEMHQSQFQKELAKRKIPIHYGEEEYRRDVKTIAKMKLA